MARRVCAARTVPGAWGGAGGLARGPDWPGGRTGRESRRPDGLGDARGLTHGTEARPAMESVITDPPHAGTGAATRRNERVRLERLRAGVSLSPGFGLLQHSLSPSYPIVPQARSRAGMYAMVPKSGISGLRVI
jgi:hypothetical protein